MQKQVFLSVVFLSILLNARSQESGLKIRRQTVGVSAYSEQISIQNRNYTMQASIGQASVNGTWETDVIRLQQGFIQPHTDPTYSVKEDEPLEVILYPNPYRDVLNLRFTEEVAAKIVVYDLLGKLIYQKNISPAIRTSLHMPQLPEGMYLIQISGDQRRFSGRIQKLN